MSSIRGTETDRFHGIEVPDPFRALEDATTPQTRHWVDEQAARLDTFLGEAEDVSRLRTRLRALATYDATTAPIRTGSGYFYRKTPAGHASNAALVFHATSPSADGSLVLDVQARHGHAATLGQYAPSPDGRRLAYVVHVDRSAWGEVRILDVDAGSLQADRLDGVHRLSTLQWSPDSRTLFYTTFVRPPDPAAPVGVQSLRRHRMGEVGRDPALAVGVESPLRFSTVRVTDDGRYAVVSTQRGSDQHAVVDLFDLRTSATHATPLVRTADAAYTFLGSAGDRLWFYTDLDAPRGRVIEIDASRPARQAWRTVVPEGPDAIAARDQTGGNALGAYGGHLVLMYLRDGRPELRTYATTGALMHTVALPPAGSVWGGLVGRQAQPDVFFQFLGLTDPSTILALDVASGNLRTVRQAAVPFDANRYEATQVFYPSKDGTRVPMFIVQRKGAPREPRPMLLYGYGALGWVSFVWFQPHLLAWLESGGIYAQPSIRGGGEYGKAWHDAALRAKKQTAVDDYLAAADWLVAEGYTARDRLVATGGSLSAPLAAAAISQRPSLFAAAVIDRPVADLLRYERFTGAAFWTPEFGSVATRDEFEALRRLSPYHEALKGTCLPPTLVMAGEFDETAPPLHAFKLVAARQAATCTSPVLMKLMHGAGHDFGKTPEQIADSFAAELAFLARVVPAARSSTPAALGRPRAH
ncbi:MAG: prolyl oligopeptidase family serine peptidase [Vicinamibacterales bacterium]